MEAFSRNLCASNGHPASDESNLDAPAQRSEIDQVSPVQFKVAKLKKTCQWGDTFMKILWGIGMQRTQNSISQIAHDNMAAWERIGEECPSMKKEHLFVEVAMMCSNLVAVIIYSSNPDPQPPTGLLVALHCAEVALITSSLSVVLRAYNLFMVGKEGIVEALRAGQYRHILFVCVAAEATSKIATVASWIGICGKMWAIHGPGAFTIFVTTFFPMTVGLDMHFFSTRYLREPSLGDSRT